MNSIKFPSTCKRWLQGNCSFGERCHYQHVHLDCIPYFFGNCRKGDQCHHRHVHSKPTIPSYLIVIDLRNQLEEKDAEIVHLNDRIQQLESKKDMLTPETKVEHKQVSIEEKTAGEELAIDFTENKGLQHSHIAQFSLATATYLPSPLVRNQRVIQLTSRASQKDGPCTGGEQPCAVEASTQVVEVATQTQDQRSLFEYDGVEESVLLFRLSSTEGMHSFSQTIFNYDPLTDKDCPEHNHIYTLEFDQDFPGMS